MPWVILKTESAKELKAQESLPDGTLSYLPMECRQYRQGRTRARKLKEIPILPRLIFIYTPLSWGLHDIIGVKYSVGSIRNPDGTICIIPDEQISWFRGKVEEWNNSLKLLYNSSKNTKKGKPKWHPIEELKTLFGDAA